MKNYRKLSVVAIIALSILGAPLARAQALSEINKAIQEKKAAIERAQAQLEATKREAEKRVTAALEAEKARIADEAQRRLAQVRALSDSIGRVQRERICLLKDKSNDRLIQELDSGQRQGTYGYEVVLDVSSLSDRYPGIKSASNPARLGVFVANSGDGAPLEFSIYDPVSSKIYTREELDAKAVLADLGRSINCYQKSQGSQDSPHASANVERRTSIVATHGQKMGEAPIKVQTGSMAGR